MKLKCYRTVRISRFLAWFWIIVDFWGDFKASKYANYVSKQPTFDNVPYVLLQAHQFIPPCHQC